MKLCSVVRAVKVNENQIVFTVPQDIVKELKVEKGQKWAVYSDESGVISFQRAEV
jgi:hypothetical protein